MIVADSIRFDTDEGRITMIIDTDLGTPMTFDIHSCVLEFEAAVRADIRPYALEAEAARNTMPLPGQVTFEGYALDDPKSPGYHDRMVD